MVFANCVALTKTLMSRRLVEHGAPQNMRQATALANCLALKKKTKMQGALWDMTLHRT